MIADQMRIAEEQRTQQAEQFRIAQQEYMTQAAQREQAMRDEYAQAEAARIQREQISAANMQRAGQTASLQMQPTADTATGTSAFKKRKKQFATANTAKAYKGLSGSTGSGMVNI
jgi:hypothetical protein